MSKKILINENAAQAAEFIGKIETKLVSALRLTQGRIKALGMEPVTKQELFEIASGNYEDLKSRYWQANFKDVEHYQSVAAREHTRELITDKFREFCKTTSLRFSDRIDNRPLNDPAFLKLVEFNEAGEPIIPEAIKEAVKESFKEYLTDPSHLKLYDAQQRAGKALEALAAALQENNLLPLFPQQMLAVFDIMTDTKGAWIFRCNNIQYQHEIEGI
ncbi:MAG: hypothetical protein JXA79_12390 [Deltaproteobacteria bacterium]|nr:hypothetical protein [Deltaproteobacteria bacterium]